MSAVVTGPRFTRLLDIFIVGLVAVAVVYGIIHRFGRDDTTCQTTGRDHRLTIRLGNFTDDAVSVRRCDTITVLNTDDADYSLNFGTHDEITAYPGFKPRIIGRNESMTITAVKAGTYTVHDHIRATAKVHINVAESSR